MFCSISPQKLKFICRCYKNGEVMHVYHKQSLSSLMSNFDECEEECCRGDFDFMIVTIYDQNDKVLTREYFSTSMDYRKVYENIIKNDEAEN